MKTYKATRGKRVGKKMQGSFYIHKSAVSELTKEEYSLYEEKLILANDFVFDIVKITLAKNEVSFIQSIDWDIENEPSVGDSICIKADNSIKKTKCSNLIYHHKWMFVKDDYTGFDVQESKNRSELWMNHEAVLAYKEDKDEKFNSKIGRRNYWNEKVCSIVGY